MPNNPLCSTRQTLTSFNVLAFIGCVTTWASFGVEVLAEIFIVYPSPVTDAKEEGQRVSAEETPATEL